MRFDEKVYPVRSKRILDIFVKGSIFLERIIFHVDVNSAFLSWEAVRRVKEGQPDIRLIPSAIGGDRDKRTGVILAKSQPAKKYGIKTGEPVGMALKKCPALYIAKPDFSLYEKSSKAFMDICREYTPVVEKFSIDECFLDMTGMSNIYPDIIAVADEIRECIKRELGFTVNVGVGSNKLLAKMASDFEKPDKMHTLFSNEIKDKMWGLPVRELFMVGASTAEKLEKAFIKTIGDLALMDPSYVKSLLGEKLGEHVHNFANGIDDSELSSDRDKAKGYSNSVTLEYDVRSINEAQKILLALSDRTAMRMRVDGGKAFCISVLIRDVDFNDRSHQRKLTYSTDVTGEIFDVCKSLLEELWNRKKALRLIGVSLTDIDFDEDTQLSFFDDGKRERARAIDQTVDHIRGKYGKNTIFRGGVYSNNKKGKTDD